MATAAPNLNTKARLTSPKLTHPMPYSTAIGMIFSLVGLLSLAFSASYIMILVSVASIGIGSSIYHPEATRMTRFASGNRQGLAQGIFQVGARLAARSARCSRLSSLCPGDKRLSAGSQRWQFWPWC